MAAKTQMLATSETSRPYFMLEVPTFIKQDYGSPILEAWFGGYLSKTIPPATQLNAAELTTLIATNNARWKPAVAASGFTSDRFSIRS